MNDEKTRQQRYEKYLAQLTCTTQQVALLVRQLQQFPASQIIIHGDHGSRIMLQGPFAENRHKLSWQDFNDGYSTLFAIKSHSQAPGLDLRRLALDELLSIVMQQFTAESLSTIPRQSFIFLTPKQGMRGELLLQTPLSELS